MKDLALLITHLELFFDASFDSDGLEEIPSRSAKLYRVRFGKNDYALKIYLESDYFGDLAFMTALCETSVPVPKIFSYDDSGAVIPEPWMVREWIESSQTTDNEFELGKAIGAATEKIHRIEVDGAGMYKKRGWSHSDWDTFSQEKSEKLRKQILQLPETPGLKRLLRRTVQEAYALSAEATNHSLLHGDLGLDTILFTKNTVKGFIDTGWCIAGSPLIDIGTFLNSSEASHAHKDGFKKGYGIKFPDPYELTVFRIYLLARKLHYYQALGNTEKYEQKRNQVLALSDTLT